MIGCVVYLLLSIDVFGVVCCGCGNWLIVGMFDLWFDMVMVWFVVVFVVGGFDVVLMCVIWIEIWMKLWGNMNMNLLSVLIGLMVE